MAADPLPSVRRSIRALLESAPEFRGLDPVQRRAMARALVRVCSCAEELRREAAVAGAPPAIALAQSAGSEFSGVAAERVAGTTRAILNAVSFPRFVTDLINGVFKAILDSNMQ